MPGVRQADLTTLQQDGNQIKDVHPRLVLHCSLSVISLLTAVQMPPWNGCHWPKKKKKLLERKPMKRSKQHSVRYDALLQNLCEQKTGNKAQNPSDEREKM